MPDIDFDNTLAGLRSDTERLPLAGAGDVRRRGDQRTHRTIAATGLTAALCLVAAFIGLGGLGDSNNRADRLPADQKTLSENSRDDDSKQDGVEPTSNDPALTKRSLLIADELPGNLPGSVISEWQAPTARQGEGQPLAAPCQKGSIKDLGAKQIWSAGFTADNQMTDVEGDVLPDVLGGQVVAQLPSDAQALSAMNTIDRWFDECSLVGAKRWPDVSVEGGRARLIEFNESPSADGPWHLVGYGVNGNAITIVSFAYQPSEVGGGAGQGILGDPTQAHAMLRYALRRIAGDRTSTANAIPRDFQFAEERSGKWRNSNEPGSANVGHVSQLGQHWGQSPCATREDYDFHAFPSDSLRTGMNMGRLYTGDPSTSPFRQLAIYADEATASVAAGELLEEYTRCQESPDEFGTQTRWTKDATTAPNVMIAWSAPVSPGTFTRGVAIVQRGNAVLLAYEGGDVTTPGPESRVVKDIRKAVADNSPLMCEVADCE